MNPWVWLAVGVGAYLLLRPRAGEATSGSTSEPTSPATTTFADATQPPAPGTPGYVSGTTLPPITRAQMVLHEMGLHVGPVTGALDDATAAAVAAYVDKYPALKARLVAIPDGAARDAAAVAAVVDRLTA